MNFYPEGCLSERDWEGAKLNVPFRKGDFLIPSFHTSLHMEKMNFKE